MASPRARSIPPNPHSTLHDILSSSFQPASPLAQQVVARDLADEDSDECAYQNNESLLTDEDSCSSDLGLDHDHDPVIMYRRPSGVAYGTTRPAIGPRPLDDEPVLTHRERIESRNAELSLLRDNHILPPKHHREPAQPEREQWWGRRLYRRLFSTKLPLPQHENDDECSETSSLLGRGRLRTSRSHGGGDVEAGGAIASGELAEQWEAAVSAGAIKTTWQREAKTIAVYSRSLVVTFMLQYSISVASIFAVGHIGKIELGAVSRKSFKLTYVLLSQTRHIPVLTIPNSWLKSRNNDGKHYLFCPLSRPGYLS